MTIRSTDYALLAQRSYRDPMPEEWKEKGLTLDGVKYRVVNHVNNPATGFQATAYMRVDSGEVVIAFRGTEFDREALRDGAVDAGMAFAGVNAQARDAQAFTKQVIADATRRSGGDNGSVNVTVTGHSLGGTLAQLEAHKFGLKGETFNAFGAAGLVHDVPEGGMQLINHVRAGDTVSAASAHFGQVRVYAVQQDIDTLSKAGYRDNGGALVARNPLKATDVGAHSIENFVPNSEILGRSIMSPELSAQSLYKAHHVMVDRYRDDIHTARTAASMPLSGPVQGVQDVRKGAAAVGDLAAQGAGRVGRAWERTADQIIWDATRALDRLSHPNIMWRGSQADPAPSLADPSHPGHAMFSQSLQGLQKLNDSHGVVSDQRTINAAGALANCAQQVGMSQVDHVDVGQQGGTLVAVQGTPGHAHSLVAVVPTVQALNTPLQESSSAYMAAIGEPVRQQQATQAQTQTQQQPVMSV